MVLDKATPWAKLLGIFVQLAAWSSVVVPVQAWVSISNTNYNNNPHVGLQLGPSSSSYHSFYTRTAASSRIRTASSRLFHAAENHEGFNVVLAPSDPSSTAFDNFKVGHARVHRYRRRSALVLDNDASTATTTTTEEAEYVLWYHGRSHQMNAQNSKLPPLSTGRIGRATSRNGLVFEKDSLTRASISEDVDDVSLGLNKESWWGFDTTHVGLGQVLLPMSTPAVMTEGGVYLMYYMGGSGEETALIDYLDQDAKLPEKLMGSTLQGMNMKIGVALSQDGITWGRVEGDDPSGACLVPYRKTDQHSLEQGELEEEELYCGWPEVAVHVSNKKEAFLMYYSTMTMETKQRCIAYAVSEDGFRWFKKGICIAPGKDDEFLDAKGCSRCCVFKDAIYDEDTEVWTGLENSWKMYYEGVSATDNKHRILMAQSKDGRTWTKVGLAFDVGEDGAWDCQGVSSPHCIR